jgi:hypothetical protein
MKIVFYIRALFGDSPLTSWDSVNVFRACQNFDLVSKLPLIEYRKKIHEIQLSCLKNVSPHIIHNVKETEIHTSNYIQPSALNQLLSLDDDDVVIPLDDDDWVSPEIKDIDFGNQHMTIWNCVEIGKNGTYYHKKNTELPYRTLQDGESEYKQARYLLSNCAAFRVSFLKALAVRKPTETKYPIDLRRCLQFHTWPRLIIREEKYLNQFTEKILDNTFAVYVRHAGNVTGGLKKMDLAELTREEFDSIISPHKNRVDVPDEFLWAKSHFDKLSELNSLL